VWTQVISAGALTDDTYDVTATVTDLSGRSTTITVSNSLEIDRTAPAASATITAITQDSGAAGDWRTNDTSLALSGTVTGTLGGGDRVQVSSNGTQWANATVSGSTWTYDAPVASPNSTLTYQVRVVDAAGNVGATVDLRAVTFDNTADAATAATLVVADTQVSNAE